MKGQNVEIIKYSENTAIGISKEGIIIIYASKIISNENEVESSILNPGNSLNIYTGIGINLPSCHTAKITKLVPLAEFGKATYVDPGHADEIVIRITNKGHRRIKIKLGDPIGCIEILPTIEDMYYILNGIKIYPK